MRRSAYWVSGVILFGLKQGIDRVVAWRFGRPWSITNYIDPGDLSRFGHLSVSDRNFYASLIAVAIPFIVIGV